MIKITKTNQYIIENFDVRDTVVILRIIKYLTKMHSKTTIRLFYETTGFYQDVTLDQLSIHLDQFGKGYTGLDEILFNTDTHTIFGIIIHERYGIFRITHQQKKQIENDLGLKLRTYERTK